MLAAPTVKQPLLLDTSTTRVILLLKCRKLQYADSAKMGKNSRTIYEFCVSTDS